jgi:hypothetical protein
MKRVIVDYAKLTNDILSLLVDKFPDGYEESDIIRFKNAQNELVEAGLFDNVQLFDSIPVIVPTDSWLKADIQAYLTAKGIEWTTSMTKAQLLELI